MLTDYNISDQWRDGDPAWLKSLTSSLYRRDARTTALPLSTVVDEVLQWLELASGEEAWVKPGNRRSLGLDIERSANAIGASLRAYLRSPLASFHTAFNRLIGSPGAVLKTPAGSRKASIWTDAVAAGEALLEALERDAATAACWDDLVTIAQDRALCGREYHPVADLLFDQLVRRGLDAKQTFQELAAVLTDSQGTTIAPKRRAAPIAERLDQARTIVATPAEVEPVVVWLGYQGSIFPAFVAGSVSFMNAHWHVPNAHPEGQNFPYKAELWNLMQHSGHLFRVATRVDEESDVDFLVRVDLGTTTANGAARRAIDLVDTILGVSVHNGGGSWPHLVQHAVLRSGRFGGSSFGVSRRMTGIPDDGYGAQLTGEALEKHGARIAEALSRKELPRFLAAALEAQIEADRPFSRDMMLRTPSEADIRSVIPLADRVVQHVAAHAGQRPGLTFDLLGERWAHARWLADVRNAVGICLSGSIVEYGERREMLDEITRDLHATKPSRPWLLIAAERKNDLLSLCKVESERTWIGRMLDSVSDIDVYRALAAEYTEEGRVLSARRSRVRNALVHGNPANFAVVESVRDYAEFLSGTALQVALESFVEGTDPADAFAERTDEYAAIQSGQDAASYWRSMVEGRDPN